MPSRLAAIGGASDAASPDLISCARALGELVGRFGSALVYGGPPAGVIGGFIDGALEAGAQDVTAIVPRKFLAERRPPGVKETIVESISDRKSLLFADADMVLVLPGGIGTLDEFFSLLEWRYQGVIRHRMQIMIYNSYQSWSSLAALLSSHLAAGLITTDHLAGIEWVTPEISAADIAGWFRTAPSSAADRGLSR